MKTAIFPSYGIAASAAAVAIRAEPCATIKIDQVAIGWALTVHKPRPMKAKPVWIKLPPKRTEDRRDA